MSDVYLRTNAPARDQFRSPRRARPTGLVVVHTAESALDVIGEDSGAEDVARFIRDRTTPGSYHDLADTDSTLQLVRYEDEAYQDGTGSNPYALSVSFACRAADWPRMNEDRLELFLRNGAAAFARQQTWLAAKGYPLTPARRVTRAQSDLGHAGFIGHGERDPGRRSDPGPEFPWELFLRYCSEVARPGASTPTTPTGDPDDMANIGPGSSAGAIKLVQTCLYNEANASKRADSPYTGEDRRDCVDGQFGPATTAAVAAYQRGRVLDCRPGVVDGVTAALLFRWEDRSA